MAFSKVTVSVPDFIEAEATDYVRWEALDTEEVIHVLHAFPLLTVI